MPHPHDHDDWFKKREAKHSAKGGSNDDGGHHTKRQKRDSDSDVKGDNKMVNKLNLTNSLRASLVTRCSMYPVDANKIFQNDCPDAASKE